MIEQLPGKRFHGIWYAVDMLCLDVGEDVGEPPDNHPEFSLRVQCQWRFVKDDEIIMASRDMYTPADPGAPDSWWDDFFEGRTDQPSLFIARIPAIEAQMRDAIVTDAGVSQLGDIHLVFSNGVYYQSFTPCSRKDEFWRAIDFRTGEHFVPYET